MARPKIVHVPETEQNWFGTTTKNTNLSQRETLEEIIINLSSLIGAKEIHKAENARGSFFYEVQAPGFSCYQSASNTILETSRVLASKI